VISHTMTFCAFVNVLTTFRTKLAMSVFVSRFLSWLCLFFLLLRICTRNYTTLFKELLISAKSDFYIHHVVSSTKIFKDTAKIPTINNVIIVTSLMTKLKLPLLYIICSDVTQRSHDICSVKSRRSIR